MTVLCRVRTLADHWRGGAVCSYESPQIDEGKDK